MHNQAREHLGTNRVQRKFERGNDAKIAVAAANSPKQVTILGGICDPHDAVSAEYEAAASVRLMVLDNSRTGASVTCCLTVEFFHWF